MLIHLKYFLGVFVTFLVILNPVSILPVFLDLTSQSTVEYQQRVALKSVVISGCILFCFALLGEGLLSGLGVSNSALLVSGGFLLFIFSIQRVLGNGNSTPLTTSQDISVFPVAIPLIAGPGALTVVMFEMNQTHGAADAILLLIALGLLLAVNWAILHNAKRVSRLLGTTGTNVITRIFGILLSAIAMQMIMRGVSAFIFGCREGGVLGG